MARRMISPKMIEPEEWITPTLLSGATGTVQYRKNQFGRVEFKGDLEVTTPTQVQFELPQGYFPGYNVFTNLQLHQFTPNQLILRISAAGNINAYGETGTITMNTLSFIAEE